MYSRISRRRHRLPEQWPRVGAVISAGASMTKQTGTLPHNLDDSKREAVTQETRGFR